MELSKKDVENEFDIRFDKYFEKDIPKLNEFINGGFIEVTNGTYKIVNIGRLIIRNIAMCFDAYLEKMMKSEDGKGKPIFSRTV